MNPRYPLVADRAQHRCEYCRAPEAVFNFPFEVEHIVPVSQDGVDDESNTALACRSCNVRKAVHRKGTDFVTGQEAPLFNPRVDCWNDHFAYQPDSGEILAKTPTGRVTIERLRLNSTLQVTARRQWVRLGLFP